MARYAALFVAVLSLWSATILSALASPLQSSPKAVNRLTQIPPRPLGLARDVGAERRQDDGSEPVFPDQPPSCPKCQQNFGEIDGCAQAAPVLQNFSMVSTVSCPTPGVGRLLGALREGDAGLDMSAVRTCRILMMGRLADHLQPGSVH